DLQLSRAGADTPEKEHKKAFGYEAAFKAPHNPKVVGSSPASATKNPEISMVSGVSFCPDAICICFARRACGVNGAAFHSCGAFIPSRS
ncbi:MAG TPA: hypothetical protein H9689_00960, partial [Firmicutes bacterium]|nr:hypothetical protein [Bacillota bacterium]